jgi:hypothetical protein
LYLLIIHTYEKIIPCIFRRYCILYD